MPLLRRNKQPDKAGISSDTLLKDTDEVFHCELSNEIFLNYE